MAAGPETRSQRSPSTAGIRPEAAPAAGAAAGTGGAHPPGTGAEVPPAVALAGTAVAAAVAAAGASLQDLWVPITQSELQHNTGPHSRYLRLKAWCCHEGPNRKTAWLAFKHSQESDHLKGLYNAPVANLRQSRDPRWCSLREKSKRNVSAEVNHLAGRRRAGERRTAAGAPAAAAGHKRGDHPVGGRRTGEPPAAAARKPAAAAAAAGTPVQAHPATRRPC